MVTYTPSKVHENLCKNVHIPLCEIIKMVRFLTTSLNRTENVSSCNVSAFGKKYLLMYQSRNGQTCTYLLTMNSVSHIM